MSDEKQKFTIEFDGDVSKLRKAYEDAKNDAVKAGKQINDAVGGATTGVAAGWNASAAALVGYASAAFAAIGGLNALRGVLSDGISEAKKAAESFAMLEYSLSQVGREDAVQGLVVGFDTLSDRVGVCEDEFSAMAASILRTGMVDDRFVSQIAHGAAAYELYGQSVASVGEQLSLLIEGYRQSGEWQQRMLKSLHLSVPANAGFAEGLAMIVEQFEALEPAADKWADSSFGAMQKVSVAWKRAKQEMGDSFIEKAFGEGADAVTKSVSDLSGAMAGLGASLGLVVKGGVDFVAWMQKAGTAAGEAVYGKPGDLPHPENNPFNIFQTLRDAQAQGDANEREGDGDTEMQTDKFGRQVRNVFGSKAPAQQGPITDAISANAKEEADFWQTEEQAQADLKEVNAQKQLASDKAREIELARQRESDEKRLAELREELAAMAAKDEEAYIKSQTDMYTEALSEIEARYTDMKSSVEDPLTKDRGSRQKRYDESADREERKQTEYKIKAQEARDRGDVERAEAYERDAEASGRQAEKHRRFANPDQAKLDDMKAAEQRDAQAGIWAAEDVQWMKERDERQKKENEAADLEKKLKKGGRPDASKDVQPDRSTDQNKPDTEMQKEIERKRQEDSELIKKKADIGEKEPGEEKEVTGKDKKDKKKDSKASEAVKSAKKEAEELDKALADAVKEIEKLLKQSNKVLDTTEKIFSEQNETLTKHDERLRELEQAASKAGK